MIPGNSVIQMMPTPGGPQMADIMADMRRQMARMMTIPARTVAKAGVEAYDHVLSTYPPPADAEWGKITLSGMEIHQNPAIEPHTIVLMQGLTVVGTIKNVGKRD